MKKHLIYKDAKSEKFWEIETTDNYFILTYGTTGTDGESIAKSFESPAECLQVANKLVKQKMKKGYAENINTISSE